MHFLYDPDFIGIPKRIPITYRVAINWGSLEWGLP